jgi:Protein of unknown function (DUF3617)
MMNAAKDMQMTMRAIKFLAGLALSMAAMQLAYAASPMRPGLWEVLVQTDLGAGASPPSRICLTQKEIDDSAKTLPRPSPTCGVVAPKTTQDKTSYDLVCPAPNAMRGHAEIKYTPNAYEGTVQMTMKVEPNKPERLVKFRFAGSRVGDCAK